MTTPESLKDPINQNNGHHDYSESISDFLSDIDDLDDLDLSGIFNSKTSDTDEDFVAHDLLTEKPVTDEPVKAEPAEQTIIAKMAEEPATADLANNVEMESSFISFETEAESVLIEAEQDFDLASANVDGAIFDVELPGNELEPIGFAVESAEMKTEEVLEPSSPESEAVGIAAESIHVEAEVNSVEPEIAQVLEPLSHEPITDRFELQDIKTEVERTDGGIEIDSPKTDVSSVLETRNLQPEVVDFEVEESKSESSLIHFESQSAEMAVVQALKPVELESTVAASNPAEIKIESEAVQVSEAKNYEPALAYVDLEEIRAQISPTKAEVEAATLETKPQLGRTDSAAPQSAAKLAPAVVTPKGKWFERLNLRTKATLLALAVGTLPVVATGTLAYFVTSPTVKQGAIAAQEARISEASAIASRFIFERYGDIQILSNLPIFANPKGTASITDTQKQAILDKYIKIYGVYDSIALLDLNGDAIVHSAGKQLPNYKDREYFQAVLKTQKPFISQPEASKVTGELSIFFAAPVFNVETGKMISIVRSRMPVKHLYEVVEGHKFGDKSVSILQEVFLADRSGKYFIADKAEEVGLKVEKDFSIFPRLSETKKLTTEVYKNTKENIEELISYSPLTPLEGMPAQNWSLLVASETKTSFAALKNLELALIAGTAVAAILVGAIAAYLANRATRPIIDSAEAVRKIGRGELNTRVSVSGQDELADLGTNINAMAEQIQASFNQQKQQASERQLLTEISQARTPQSLESPLNVLLAEIRAAMQLDRAVVYRFYPDWSGHIVGESVLPGWPIALADKIEDACIPQALLDAYRKGRVVPTSDVFNAGFHPDHLELMKRLQIKANLVVPILQGEELFGILVAHHCAKTHNWEQSEIEYLQEVASKMGAPMGSLALFERQEYEAEQERNRSQALQMELMNLLDDVQGASDGDLTVRADVSAGEIGIVADFFNSIVESLRDIVSQVKDASAQVNTSVGNNEVVMGQLAEESQAQAQQVTNTLKSVEQMALSIQEVAENARKASKVAGIASTTAVSGGKTMDRTVDSILQLRETVAETSKKVKRLGESSQQISKAVSLINQIALQTNLLAINASIEAARAGKEGRGFAVVAEEVGALAAQSAEATKEIEQIVETIQSETGEVVDAMERGTTQVVEGTRQVEEAKESLQQIVKVSRQIDKLLQSISSATVSQTEASEVVKQLMQQVTQSSERASDTSRQVSGSLQETVAIAQQLQASVGTFKVES